MGMVRMKLSFFAGLGSLIVLLYTPAVFGSEEDSDCQREWSQSRIRAEQGDIKAQVALGIAAYNHFDYDQAARWLRSSAEKGESIAQLWLSRLYFMGRGVPRDDDAGLRWLIASAERGSSSGSI
jgi:TPR repeat protein